MSETVVQIGEWRTRLRRRVEEAKRTVEERALLSTLSDPGHRERMFLVAMVLARYAHTPYVKRCETRPGVSGVVTWHIDHLAHPPRHCHIHCSQDQFTISWHDDTQVIPSRMSDAIETLERLVRECLE